MLTEKDYCDKDTYVALKEMGYSEDFILAKDYEILDREYDIHLYDAHKWLREKKGLHIEIDRVRDEWLVSVVETKKNLCLAVKNRYDSYEEALLEGIKEAVKILKKK